MHTLLIVEDQEDIRDSLQSQFVLEGYSVDTASDGREAVGKIKKREYDCVVMDYVMPRMDGKEACKEIRELGICVPIIMLSVKSEPLTKAELLDCGADDYLGKPFSSEELLARIRALLRRPKALKSDVLNVGDLTMDVKAHQVSIQGRPIYLTRKEFSLLECLLRHKGSAVSRERLVTDVWGGAVGVHSNTIESHILSLRKKIDHQRARGRLIHTMPGVGYRVEALVLE